MVKYRLVRKHTNIKSCIANKKNNMIGNIDILVKELS